MILTLVYGAPIFTHVRCAWGKKSSRRFKLENDIHVVFHFCKSWIGPNRTWRVQKRTTTGNSNMAIETGSTNSSESTTDIVEIPTANLDFRPHRDE